MIFFFEIVNIGPFMSDFVRTGSGSCRPGAGCSGLPFAIGGACRTMGKAMGSLEFTKTTYMKTVHIVGNRPQFVKLSLLYRAWERRGVGRPLIVHTGQHFSDNMSAVFFEDFHIPAPDHQLNINSQPHAGMIGQMLIALDAVIAREKPDGIVVYGDTNTTLAGALAAKKRNIPLAHVESGIRTGKEDMPEESNRYLTDRLAGLNFTCTYRGMENLLKEGYTAGRDADLKGPGTGEKGELKRAGGEEGKKDDDYRSAGAGREQSGAGGSGVIDSLVYNTGDLMLDAALLFKDKARERSSLLRQLDLEGKPFILATIHRTENLEDPGVLREILHALHVLHRSLPVVFPVHPRTRQLIDQHGIPLQVLSVPPIGYLDMIALVQACRHVITDSGGLSREAFFFHKPSVIVMQHPFWPEILEHGPSLQADADSSDILEKFQALGNSSTPFKTELFGDGHAAERISDILLRSWQALHS